MSRFITAPDLVEKENFTVTLIDPSTADIERVGLYCASAEQDYDIYLYNGELGDLQYLQEITDRSDKVLINDVSHVNITGSNNVERIGTNQLIKTPLDYFQSLNG